jgi:hypothetical protein
MARGLSTARNVMGKDKLVCCFPINSTSRLREQVRVVHWTARQQRLSGSSRISQVSSISVSEKLTHGRGLAGATGGGRGGPPPTER